MKVNMTPNPLDVVTIHASQNDGEAREWEFELHNNGELIDTSGITEQLFFKAYKGGTEQLLPENGSVPTTSPFIGDIRYPQGLLTDQEFLYRQSPTEEDGLAKITDIKGNTLVWNQLVQNGNFADGTNGWRKTNQTDSFSVSNNILSFHTNHVYGSVFNTLPIDVNNHVLLIKAQVRTQGNSGIVRAKLVNDFGYTNNTFVFSIEQVNVWTDVLMYGTYTTTPQGSTESPKIGFQDYRNISSSNLIEVKNVQVFDLTLMGLDITDPSDFTSLFPLSYYSYNQGSLLSFNGNGIKTVGKNQYNVDDANADAYVTLEKSNGEIRVTYDGTNAQRYRGFYMYREEPYVNGLFLPKQYTVSFDVVGTDTTWVFGIRSVSTNSFHSTMRATINSDGHYSFTFNPSQLTEDYYLSASRTGNKTTAFDITFSNIQMEIGTETSYVPYTSSTLSLPISTYFPTGMKSAGNVYDELTETGYAERTVYIKFDGTQPWSTRTTSGGSVLYEFVPPGIKDVGTQATAQISNNIYPWNTNLSENKTIRQVNITISVRRDDITSLQAWYSELASNPLEVVYKLATPTETSFTTASLVTENAEISLSNNDGTLIGKCTEELSTEPGFHDAKIKLSDGDGTCYSNKLQLHVERSPQ